MFRDGTSTDGIGTDVPSTVLARLFWHALTSDPKAAIAGQYVFDVGPMTMDRPYFAAYVRPQDLLRTLDRLDILQDDWGNLLLWATLALAGLTAGALIVIPLLLAGRALRGQTLHAPAAIVFFGCLGLGYITAEVGLISYFTRALNNPTISAAVVISGMLLFSGIGSLLAERLPMPENSNMPEITTAADIVGLLSARVK